MRKRITAMILCSLVAAGVLTGCGNGNESRSSSDNTAISTVQTEATEAETMETPAEPSSEETSDRFNAAEALENTYLCGVQLAPDMTWGMLGENFSIVPEGATASPGNDKVLCDVNYKGQYIGQFIFQGCSAPEDITSDTVIRQIKADTDYIAGYEGPVISVYGLTLGASHEELYDVMGSDYEIGVNECQILYTENGIMRYHFGYKALDETDKLVLIIIYFPQ